jgi:hypothetical protein
MDTTQIMQLYGYPKDQDLDAPIAIGEVTILADPKILRCLARFLDHSAEQMEKQGERFGHEHFSDFLKERFGRSADIVVSRPDQSAIHYTKGCVRAI